MLILNLNEIMEEFAETAEDSMVERVEIVIEKEVQGQDVKPKFEKERRKRKRVEEEENQESDEELDEFIFYKAYEIMEKKIIKKDFIGEKGFKKFISLSKEIIEKRGWKFICRHLPSGFAALMREFYSKLEDRKGTQWYVKGKWVSFNKKDINQVLKLGKLSDGTKFKKLKKNPDYQEIVEVLIVEKENGRATRGTPMNQ